MGFKITGKLYHISETQTVKETFRKREFIVLYNENPGDIYSKDQYLKFEVILDKCNLLDKFKEGDTVEVFFNLQGREWINPKGEKVYFNTLSAYDIQKLTSEVEQYPQYSIDAFEESSMPV
ncbi:MAG: DUF3127 domain-containing protein, partial [Bacteroidia bacterium]|nr:DUF3127 domain-containing protein [Bacteroidia bacterium]